MLVHHLWRRHRLKSIAAVVGIHLLLGYILLVGLRIDGLTEAAEELTLLRIEQLPEAAPPPESSIAPDPEEEGASAPADLRAEASPVAAPEPAVVIPRPQPVTAAPDPNEGTASSQGASERPGPGSGAGGAGEGTGRGAGGGGPGGGSVAIRARHIAGEITRADYPRPARAARAVGVVGANLDIGRDGRVTDCAVVQSSGNADLDAATCRMIRQRFRYAPARNASGEPVADRRGWRQRWCLGRSDCPVG